MTESDGVIDGVTGQPPGGMSSSEAKSDRFHTNSKQACTLAGRQAGRRQLAD